MIKIRIRNTANEWFLLLVFYLLLLQSPLEKVSAVFSYVDEAFALLGVLVHPALTSYSDS